MSDLKKRSPVKPYDTATVTDAFAASKETFAYPVGR